MSEPKTSPIEYLIRCESMEWWSPIDMPRVLCPRTIASEPCPGWGDHRIRVGDNEVSFSFEDSGWQVTFEGTALDERLCRQIVEEILQNLETATGEQGRVIDL
ncbi:MAG: hypothetical protein QM783_02145 [Phycisphaerales bacterium]